MSVILSTDSKAWKNLENCLADCIMPYRSTLSSGSPIPLANAREKSPDISPPKSPDRHETVNISKLKSTMNDIGHFGYCNICDLKESSGCTVINGQQLLNLLDLPMLKYYQKSETTNEAWVQKHITLCTSCSCSILISPYPKEAYNFLEGRSVPKILGSVDPCEFQIGDEFASIYFDEFGSPMGMKM